MPLNVVQFAPYLYEESTFDRCNRMPVSQWSFGVQHTLRRDYLVERGYAGTAGQKPTERRKLHEVEQWTRNATAQPIVEIPRRWAGTGRH